MKEFAVFPIIFSALIAAGILAATKTTASELPTRQSGEEVNSAAVRQRQGLRPNTNLLFNGWGVTPAGKQVLVSDLALKLVVTQDQQRVIATHGGFNNEGVTILDLASQQQTQFFPLDEAWNGIAFSRDGHRFFVSGGDSGLI